MLPLRPRKFHLTAVKSRLNVLTRLLVILYITLSAIYLYMSRDPSPPAWGFHRNPAPVHPIDHLIVAADRQWRTLLGREADSLENAAELYRRRRGRHPPPGFAEWHRFAKDRGALMIEELFDQIYHDVSPYWGIEPWEFRRQASGFTPRIIVRNHTAMPIGGTPAGWMEAWLDLLRTIEKYLPDLDMPLNGMDELA
ncbi:hypothetical protein EYZ11_013239 [Aspergillus tanneri]|uniref:Glycosyl transferase CAP10 domain-containing protein n=1 Tax=Aspergillus tanneri TaxID=1220188 RepID=A0A4S3J0D3_9EURO|nr:hypothetical protein EYZ11_013239 [Aspergillus tanneri]